MPMHVYIIIQSPGGVLLDVRHLDTYTNTGTGMPVPYILF